MAASPRRLRSSSAAAVSGHPVRRRAGRLSGRGIVAVILGLAVLIGAPRQAAGDRSTSDAPPAGAEARTGLADGGFEAGRPGEVHPDWPAAERSDAAFEVAVTEHGRGGRGLRIEGRGERPWLQGVVEQELDAAAYRGRSVRLTAWIRVVDEPAGKAASAAEARLHLYSPLPGGDRFYRMQRSEPFGDVTRSGEGEGGWRRVALGGRVDPEAESLRVGLSLAGGGEAVFDDVHLEILDEARVGHAPPAPLTERGRANLVALARLVSRVRYFHPSDAAATADWDAVLLAGVRQVEGAADAADLARRLEALLGPLAPTLSVFPGAGPVPPPPAAGATGRRVVWRHLGVGTGRPPFVSERLILPVEEVPRATLEQSFDASSLAGSRLRLTASARRVGGDAGPAAGEGGPEARLRWLALDRDSEEERVLAAVPVISATWERHRLEAEVPEGLAYLGVELEVRGDGGAEIDDVTLYEVGDDGEARPTGMIANGDFEDGATGLEPLGWRLAEESPAHAFRAEQVADAAEGALAARLVRHPEADPEALVPAPEDAPVVALGGGVSARLPSSLWVDAAGATLPPGPPPAGALYAAPSPTWYPATEDRTTRLAGVLRTWAVIHHFYPYFDLTDPDASAWAAARDRALKAAATSYGDDYREILQRQLAALRDGHGWVVPLRVHEAGPPFTWAMVEGDVVITSASPEAVEQGLAPGDRVVALDGEPMDAVLARARTRASAATDGFSDLVALGLVAAGPPGSVLELTVEPFSPQGRAVARTARVVRSAELRGIGPAAEARPEPIADLAPGVVYVDLTRVEEELDRAWDHLAAAEAVVFDLRGYPTGAAARLFSHLRATALSSARWRVPEVWMPDRGGPGGGMGFSFTNWTVVPAEPRIGGRVAFLTDAGALSYGETLMGIVDHYDLGIVVGSPTAGTNGNANGFELPGGLRVSFTGMRVTRHDGSPHHGAGVLPDVVVRRTRAGVAAGRDEVLEVALERLGVSGGDGEGDGGDG